MAGKIPHLCLTIKLCPILYTRDLRKAMQIFMVSTIATAYSEYGEGSHQ